MNRVDEILRDGLHLFVALWEPNLSHFSLFSEVLLEFHKAHFIG